MGEREPTRESQERERVSRESQERERVSRESQERESQESLKRENLKRESQERERESQERESLKRESQERERERVSRERERERESQERVFGVARSEWGEPLLRDGFAVSFLPSDWVDVMYLQRALITFSEGLCKRNEHLENSWREAVACTFENSFLVFICFSWSAYGQCEPGFCVYSQHSLVVCPSCDVL